MFNQLPKKPLLFVLLSLTALMAGCSGAPVTQDYSTKAELINFKTYQWLDGIDTSASKTLKQKQPFVAERIEQAILKNLHARGAMIVRDNAPAFIDYGYSITRTEVLEPSTTIGLGIGSRHFGFGGMFPVDYETRIYEDANWQVDIYNRDKKLIWRGSLVKPVEKFDSPTEAQIYTQEIIDNILNQYPPK